MKNRKKVRFIINPISGTPRKQSVPDAVQVALSGQFETEIAFTEAYGHARVLAADAVKSETAYVVAVGGDGTVNEVASSLLHTPSALGIIPSGSGNGLARHLRIPLNLQAALRVISNEKAIKIDAGTINDKPFFCTAGVGFDAHIGRKFAVAGRRGLRTYIQTTLNEYFSYIPDNYKISTKEGLLEREAFLITVANAGQYGNNAFISPDADIQDGLLDLCIIQPFPKYFGFEIGMRLFNKTINKSRFMEIQKVTMAEISANAGKYYHLDGECFEIKDDLKINVLPSALQVLV